MVVRLYNTVNLNSTNYGVGRAFVPKTKQWGAHRAFTNIVSQDLLDIQDLMYLFY